MSVDELIKEIAVKHGIGIGREDPIMILHTVNERLIQDSGEAQKKIVNAFKSEMEALSHRWGEDAKTKAERTINAALAASRAEIVKGIKEGVKAASDAVIKGLEESSLQITRQVKLVAKLNIISAVIALISAFIILWAVKF